VSLPIGCTRLLWCSHSLCVALYKPHTISNTSQRDIFKTKAIQQLNEYFGAFDVKILNTMKEIIDTNTKGEISQNTRVLAQRHKVMQRASRLHWQSH